MADLENLEQLAHAATPGRWSEIERCNNADDDRSCGVTSDQKTAYGHAIGIFQSDAYDECSHPVSRANAAFIAAANPETVLKLIAALRDAWSRIEQANEDRGCNLYGDMAELRKALGL